MMVSQLLFGLESFQACWTSQYLAVMYAFFGHVSKLITPPPRHLPRNKCCTHQIAVWGELSTYLKEATTDHLVDVISKALRKARNVVKVPT